MKKVLFTLYFFLLTVSGLLAQSTITGRVFNDISANNAFDTGEEMSNIKVWLFDMNAVAPRYRVSPVDSVITNASGIFIFTAVIAGSYQVRVMASSLPASVTRAIYDNDGFANGFTELNAVDGTSTYNNINFGFAPTATAPVFTSDRNFNWNSGNNFINQTSQTYNLAPEICNAVPFNPTITWTTDRTIAPGGPYGANSYPQAAFPGAIIGQNYPGNNKGGIHNGDTTFQLLFGGNGYTPVNNDRQTTTIQFSNSVINTKFSLYDIDHADPQVSAGRIDRVKVTGYDGSNPVMPVILNPSASPWNMVSGNTVCGWADYPLYGYTVAYNSQNQDNGTVNVYFQNRIDRIVVEYEEWAPILLPGKGINDAAIPAFATNESSWSLRSAPTIRGISIGSIDYTFECLPILPVSLISFDASQSACNAVLNWETAQEQHLTFFEIEHSTEGSNFQILNKVRAKNILSGNRYVYPLNPASMKMFYRLRIIDTDGKFQYSPIISVEQCLKNYKWSISPNPVKTGTDVTVSVYSPGKKTASFILWDATGKKVLQKTNVLARGENLLRIRISNLTAGIYLAGLLDDSNNVIGTTQKIILE